MPKSLRAALVAVAAFALLWLFAREVLGLLLLGAAMVFALGVATMIVVALVDLAGPTRTDAQGNVLGMGGRMRARVSQLALAFGARPWRTPAGVRKAALRSTAPLRVTRPGGPAAAEHLVVTMNPQTLVTLDDYQHLDEVVWDLAENYREATAGLPAAAGMVTVWMFADPRVGRGRVRARTALREPAAVSLELVAHASRPLDPGRILPRGQGAREGFPAPGQPRARRPAAPTTQPPPSAGDQTEVLTRAQPAAAAPDAPDLTAPLGSAAANRPSHRDDTVPIAAGRTAVVAAPAWSVALQTRDQQDSRDVAALREGDVLLVGRADPARSGAAVHKRVPALVIADIHVSRSHLELRAAGGRLTVTDLGSSTGTYISGQRLRPAEPLAIERGTMIDLAWQASTGLAAARLHVR